MEKSFIIVFGDNVNINADITGSIYIVANRVTITGGADDAYIMAETVNFEENSYISRNARVISEDLNLKGSIERDLYSLSEKTNILESQFGVVRGKLYYKDNLNEYNRSLRDLKELFEMSVDDSILLDTSSMGMDEVSVEIASQIMPAMRKRYIKSFKQKYNLK